MPDDREADVCGCAIHALARMAATDSDPIAEYERRRAEKAASRAHEQRDASAPAYPPNPHRRHDAAGETIRGALERSR